MAAQTIPFPGRAARFSLVVAQCGRPDIHLSLVAPSKDPVLQSLAKQSRVMTIHQARRGAGADYGMAGLFAERGAQLLVFPKSLRRFAGKRIVGINYRLLSGAARFTGEMAAVPHRAKSRSSAVKAKQETVRHRSPQPEPPPDALPPPTMRGILRELQGASRLLGSKKYSTARNKIRALAELVQAGLKLP